MSHMLQCDSKFYEWYFVVNVQATLVFSLSFPASLANFITNANRARHCPPIRTIGETRIESGMVFPTVEFVHAAY